MRSWDQIHPVLTDILGQREELLSGPQAKLHRRSGFYNHVCLVPFEISNSLFDPVFPEQHSPNDQKETTVSFAAKAWLGSPRVWARKWRVEVQAGG